MRRSLLVWVSLLLIVMGLVGTSVGAQEKPQDYPRRQIELLVGAGPGGGTDIFARTLVLDARRTLGVPVVVLNIPAAGGAECVAELQTRPADGYTVMAINPVQIIANVMGRSPYGVDSFEPIIMCQHDILMLLVRKDSPFKTVQDLLDHACKNPGKVTVGGTSPGSFDEVMVTMFSKAAGIQTKYIPFDSGSEMQSQLLGGHVDAIVDEPGPVAPLVDAGQMRVLLVFAEERLEAFPDVPCSVELGWDVTLGAWRGIAAKKGTPREIVDYLHEVFKNAMNSGAYKAVEKSSYLDLRPGYRSPDGFRELMQTEQRIYSEVLSELGYAK